MKESIDREERQFEREICFFSDNLDRLVRMTEVEQLKDDEVSMLIRETTAVHASLGGVIQDINARMDSGEEVEYSWSRRVRTKSLIVKRFLDALKKEKKDRSIIQRDKCFRTLIMTILGVKETNVLINKANKMTEEEREELNRQLKIQENS